MDFINEKYVLTVEVGQDGSQVAGALNCRSGGNPDVNPHLHGNDVSQGGLTQSGWAVEEDVVESLAPAFGGGDSYVQVALYLVLPDKIAKSAGSQTGFKWYVLGAWFTRHNTSYFTLPP